jgi:hypothetical protein
LTAFLLRFVDADVPAVELVAVEPLSSRSRSHPVGKLDERESSWPTAVTIGGQEHAEDLTRLAKEALEVALGGLKAQVPNEESRVDGVLLSDEDALGALPEPSPAIIGARAGCVRFIPGRVPVVGPSSEWHCAGVTDGQFSLLADGAGRRERNQQLAEVVGRKPTIRASRGYPDTIACLVGTTWSPGDHFDFQTVRHTLGRGHLAGLVTEEERRRVAAPGTIDEDALSYRDYGESAPPRRRDGPSAGQERRQRTSSGKCA